MVGHLLLCILLFQTIEAQDGARLPPQGPKKWMTLNGGEPVVVARGGFSGFFPDSSRAAYDYAADMSLSGTILYCNLHFSKDNDGFCVQRMNLQNATTIDEFDHHGAKTYNIYGQQVHGYFGLDYPSDVIFQNVTLRQSIFTRPWVYDGLPILGPFQLLEIKNTNRNLIRLWINIENDMFYNQHNISAEAYLLDRLKELPEYISSPEIGFLKSLGPKLGRSKTKLIFTFLGLDEVEPTTKTPYGALIKNLAAIKSFASGIAVPKDYIWPIGKGRLLQPATTLVQDAHKAGLEVFASGFANDRFLSYNYSYDPALEYLQFVSNSQFSVDGVISEFPSTASEAIGCLNQDKKAARDIKALIISHNGASGDYPGSTDLAYQKAIDDGADIIDCAVQMSKDGVAFCSDRADLMRTTTAATLFIDRSANIPEIQPYTDGIFSFDLTWSEIQTLRPQLESSFEAELVRNPANKYSGKFVTLHEFLDLAKTKAVHGILIFIQNAAYLASKKGLDIVGTVSSALSNATFDKQSLQKVLIQSEDTSVLAKFKGTPSYERVFYVEQPIDGAPAQVAEEVKKYADSVFVHRNAIVTATDFLSNFTKTVPAFYAANISVYTGILKNEFQNLAFDYLSDPYVELSTLYSQHVDGFVTEFPATADMFARSSCTRQGSPYLIKPVQPGFLFHTEPLAQPPMLSSEEVVDPPLPAVAKSPPAPAPDSSKQAPKANSAASTMRVNAVGLMFAAMLLLLLTIYS